MKHQFIVECESEKNFDGDAGDIRLRDHVAGRLWEMDGVVHGTAQCRSVPRECMIITRTEYEALQSKVSIYEKMS